MARAFNRSEDVYFIGAGFSKGFGLPLTSELLSCLEDLSATGPGKFMNGPGGRVPFKNRLETILASFYPDGEHPGYRPTVVDFFSSLTTYIDLEKSFPDSSFPGQQPEAFMRLLKLGITRVLIDRTRANNKLIAQSDLLDEIVKPGAIVITSNWDLLFETAASSRGVPLRRTMSPTKEGRSKELTLLKLHGSLDWLQVKNRKMPGVADNSEYRPLTTLTGLRDNVGQLASKPDDIIRVPWELNSAWRQIRARSSAPHIVTMATGKSDDLGPLRSVWRDAYSGVSMAKNLYILGYSIPPDDTEIRTLLRAGIFRGKGDPTVVVRNPSPDVHDRARKYLQKKIISDYSAIRP